MAYCTVADIQQDFPSVVFTDDERARVKLASIPDFIADADSLINSYLSSRYATPVAPTAVDALGVLRLYSRSLVSDKISGILRTSQSNTTGANQNVRTGLSTKDVLAILADIRDSITDLQGATLRTSGTITAAFATGAAPATRFTLGTDQW